jgi:hypothetical protein
MLTRQQQQAIDSLRATRGGPAGALSGSDVQEFRDITQNMNDENDLATRNQMTIMATPAARRQHLAQFPNGTVYMPDPGTMARTGQESVYGAIPGGTGYDAQQGIAALGDPAWAGFFNHFADKDRFFKSYAGQGVKVTGAF